MRVVTTCTEASLGNYAHRWLDGRKNWPKGTEFYWYTEGYELPYQADEKQSIEVCGLDDGKLIVRKDFSQIPEFVEWKAKHAVYKPPGWQWNVIGYAHKVFAAIDAFYDYDGIGVWLDADCVTFKNIPKGLVEAQVHDDYLACYQRTGAYTETGMWIMDCSDPIHKQFLDFWKNVYLTDRFTQLTQWHDCMTLDATIKAFGDLVTVNNLSGDFARDPHPQSKTEFAKYIDHCKGPRKSKGKSPENKFHK